MNCYLPNLLGGKGERSSLEIQRGCVCVCMCVCVCTHLCDHCCVAEHVLITLPDIVSYKAEETSKGTKKKKAKPISSLVCIPLLASSCHCSLPGQDPYNELLSTPGFSVSTERGRGKKESNAHSKNKDTFRKREREAFQDH